MNNPQDKFEKVFTCEMNGLSAMLDACMTYVDQHQDSCLAEPEIRSRLKWAITELLTNAIKHSGASECRIGLHCTSLQLILEKTDQGNPLYLIRSDTGKAVQWPVTQNHPDTFEIYQNGADALWVEISAEGKATFQAKPVTDFENIGLSGNIAEHFGLMILTKASSSFGYEFDAASKTNKFCCIFNWSKQ